MKPPLNLILPVYRPQGGWEIMAAEHLAALQQSCTRERIPLVVYLINDGSDEDLYFPETVLSTLRKAVENFKFQSYHPNHGKGYALRYGVSLCDSGFLIYTDYDFPFGIGSLLSAYQMLEAGAEVVMGKRYEDYVASQMLSRRILSWGVRRLNSLVLGLPQDCLDSQSGLKGFCGRGRQAFLMTRIETFLFDTEFILIARRNQLNIAVIPLKLRGSLRFSRMGFKVVFRELAALARIFFRCRIGSRIIFRKAQTAETEDSKKTTGV